MHKIDNWIIEQLDKGTTLIQKNAWLPLNTLIMGAECLYWTSFLSLALAMPSLPSLFFTCFCGLGFYIAFNKWKKDAGYWENQRKTLELNAMVLLEREHKSHRAMWVPIMLAVGTVNALIYSLNGAGLGVTAIILMYLRCCRYMGPGDYACQRQAKLSGLPQGN